MSMSDPIADLLTRIRNANQRMHVETRVPNSKIKQRILDVLKEEGFITGYEVMPSGAFRELVIQLKYYEGKRIIRNIVSAAVLDNSVDVNTPQHYFLDILALCFNDSLSRSNVCAAAVFTFNIPNKKSNLASNQFIGVFFLLQNRKLSSLDCPIIRTPISNLPRSRTLWQPFNHIVFSPS